MRSPKGYTDPVRERIFQGILSKRVTAAVIAEGDGILSGLKEAITLMSSHGLRVLSHLQDGMAVHRGQELIRVEGDPMQIAWAEERIIGALSKASGIATAAQMAVRETQGRFRVVSGGWKKMPIELKDMIRKAVMDGGAQPRISNEPFVYLDKNYVRMLGGVREAVQSACPLGRKVVVQIRGEFGDIRREALTAVRHGARVVMVDTGNREDLVKVSMALVQAGLRDEVQIAFGGGVTVEDLSLLRGMDLDVVDMGYAILDAPCLRMRFDVIGG